VQRLVLTGSPQQSVAVRLALHQGGSVHQRLRRVPDDVADRLLGVDAEEVLEDGEEGDLLRCVLHPVVHGVEDVQVRGEVDIVRPRSLGLVALSLLLEDVQLDPEVRVPAGGLDLPQYFQQLQTYELIPQSVSVLQLRSGDNEAIDEGQENSSVFVCLGLLQLLNNNVELVSLSLESLVMVQSLQGSTVSLSIVDTQSREELEHLLLHLAAVRVQSGCKFCGVVLVFHDIIQTNS